MPLSPYDISGSAPVPLGVPLLTVPDGAGGARIWSSEWIGLVCSVPPTLTVGFGVRAGATLPPLPHFGVSLPPSSLLVPPGLPALLVGAEAEILAGTGLDIVPGAAFGVPVVRGCPLRIECCDGLLLTRCGAILVSAAIVAIHLPEGTFGPERWAELARLRPLERAFAVTEDDVRPPA